MSHTEDVPDELMGLMLKKCDDLTLMHVVPQVCKRWRFLCRHMKIHINFRYDMFINTNQMFNWFTGDTAKSLRGTHTKFKRENKEWRSGICEIFPEANAITIPATIAGNTAEILEAISKLRNLKLMYIEKKITFTDMGFFCYRGEGKTLTAVDMNMCDLTDETVIMLVNACPKLTTVSFSSNYKLTDVSIYAIARYCDEIKNATFDSLRTVTDTAMCCFAERYPGLNFLSVLACRNLTDTFLSAVGTHCKEITHLEAGCCPLFTDTGALTIAKNCKKLKHISFCGNNNLTARSQRAFKDTKHTNFVQCTKMF